MTQAQRILQLLRERGKEGASNFELMKISYQYPARIHTLRHKFGHEIESKHLAGTEWRLTLIKDADRQPKPVDPDVPQNEALFDSNQFKPKRRINYNG